MLNYKLLIGLLILLAPVQAQNTQTYETIKEQTYLSDAESADPYRKERGVLDIYYPTGSEGFETVIFFHGGGLEGGNKFIPEELKQKGVAVVAPNYRLSPKATHPDYIEDAAQAVAWTVANISRYGGDPSKIYVSGHSAGGYLTLMLALDTTYLQKRGIHPDQLAGYAPLSGQTNTHYTIRKERKQNPTIPVIDAYAPIWHARKMQAPMLLITGDRKKELLARYTENLHLQEILLETGNQEIPLYELNGFDHGTMLAPGCLLLMEMIGKHRKVAQ